MPKTQKTAEEVCQELFDLVSKKKYDEIAEKIMEYGKERYLQLEIDPNYESESTIGTKKFFHKLVKFPLSEKDTAILDDINKAIVKKYAKVLYESVVAYENKYKEQVFKGELPGTEFVAGNEKESNKLAAVIAYSSKEALNCRGLDIGADELFDVPVPLYHPYSAFKLKIKRIPLIIDELKAQHPKVDKETVTDWYNKFAYAAPTLRGYHVRNYPDDTKPLIEKFPEEAQKYLDATDSEFAEYKRVIERDKDILDDGERSLRYINAASKIRSKYTSQKEKLSPKTVYDANKHNIEFFLTDDTSRQEKGKSDSYRALIESLQTLKDMQKNPELHQLKDVRKAIENAARAAEAYETEHSGFRNLFSSVLPAGKNRLNAARSLSETLKDNLKDFDHIYPGLSDLCLSDLSTKKFAGEDLTVGEVNKRVETHSSLVQDQQDKISDLTDQKLQEIRNTYLKKIDETNDFETQKAILTEYASTVIAVNMHGKAAKNALENLSESSEDEKNEHVEEIKNEILNDVNIEESSDQIRKRKDFQEMMDKANSREGFDAVKDLASKGNGIKLLDRLMEQTVMIIQTDTDNNRFEMELDYLKKGKNAPNRLKK